MNASNTSQFPGVRPRVCLLDYGAGNVKSVANLLTTIVGHDGLELSNQPESILDATHLILPGVGAFGAAMRAINERIPMQALEKAVFERGTPFLGICVGLQVLATAGEEFGRHQGLGWLPGTVRTLRSGELPLPHIGWNDVEPDAGSSLLPATDDFYFVHSYVFEPDDASTTVGQTTYGEPFCAMARRDNIWGVQFHPEKSQAAGRGLIERFLALESK